MMKKISTTIMTYILKSIDFSPGTHKQRPHNLLKMLKICQKVYLRPQLQNKNYMIIDLFWFYDAAKPLEPCSKIPPKKNLVL